MAEINRETIIVHIPPLRIEIEEWRSIPGLSNYEASSFGRIRSLDQILEQRGRWGEIVYRPIKGRVLRCKPKPNGCGTRYWSFHAGKGDHRMVSRCVCAAFHGPPPSRRHEAAHLDRNTNNNRPPNLEWATPIENADHKRLHGTAPTGSRNGSSKIDENDVVLIFKAYIDEGLAADLIGVRCGISKSAVFRILRGDGWAHVDVGQLRAAAARKLVGAP